MNQVKAVTEYANMVHASVQKGNLFATQFHPEKSGDVGLQILKNFIRQKKPDEKTEE
jgi:glutamine amidotransferase